MGGAVFASPEAAPIEDGVVVLREGRIAAVGPRAEVEVPMDAERLDCAGASVLAGFWNCHVHFTEAKWTGAEAVPAEDLAAALESMLTRHGFVHVFDTGSDLVNTTTIRRRIESGELSGPSIRTTGIPFVPPQGSPYYAAPLKLPELSSPEQATEKVRSRIAAGADAVKLFAASPVAPDRAPVLMPLPVLRAAVAAAHAEHRLVLAHPTNNAGIEIAIEGGVDVLLHTAPDGGEEWDDAFVKRLRAAGVALVPTLKLWEFELERKHAAPEQTDRFLALACQQLHAFAAAGGEVLFGTDVGYMTDHDPREEYLLLEQAGLDWRAILASLTTAPARRFGVEQRTGRLEAGCAADVVVLEGRPDEDVRSFARVRSAWRDGRRISPRR